MTELTKNANLPSELKQELIEISEKSPKNKLIMHDELKAKYKAKMENKKDQTDESKISSWFLEH